MKSRLSLPVHIGIVLALMAGQLFANWTVGQPIKNTQFSRDADISVSGTGTQMTTATAHLRNTDSGITQDTFNFTTNDEDAMFGGEFDISGQWPIGFHGIYIYEGPTQVYPGAGQTHEIQIIQNP